MRVLHIWLFILGSYKCSCILQYSDIISVAARSCFLNICLSHSFHIYAARDRQIKQIIFQIYLEYGLYFSKLKYIDKQITDLKLTNWVTSCSIQ